MPRWTNPLRPDDGGKVVIGPLPPSLLERQESPTAVMPAAIREVGEPVVRIRKPRGAEVVGPRPMVTRAVPGAPAATRAPPAELKTSIGLTGEIKELGERFLSTDVDRVQVHPLNDVTKEPDVYVPPNRRFFSQFIIQAYQRYRLADLPEDPDPDACAKAAAASKKEVKTFAYQSFIRDYMQKPSPYRGVLVYHGLGSGKTCTSIASLEALYQAHQRPVYIFTPASLQPNYRDEIMKCGPYIYRLQNHWRWVPVPTMTPVTQELSLLLEVLKLPRDLVKAQKGGWVPDPSKPPNFDSLTGAQQKFIVGQIISVMDSRFIFINYNGVGLETVKAWACKTPGKFDGATIVIDEVHNLVRTINNSGLEVLYKSEPRNMAQYKPAACDVATLKYNRSYLLYRLLCDAVGAKIIALSATPIINFPQEIAILANLLAGDGRMAEAIVPAVDSRKEALIAQILKFHPEVDFFEVKPRTDGSGTSTVRLTPVPSGFRKVVNPKTGEFRGFIRDVAAAATAAEIARERDLPAWIARVNASLTEKAVGFPAAVKPAFRTYQRLPDIEKPFEETFIDTESLTVKSAVRLPLMARLSGLISYYKGGKADLMASSKDYIVEVDMSASQLAQYTKVRKVEIDREKKSKGGGKSQYAQATETVNSTFKIFSRAACNFSFPEELARPTPADYRDVLKMLGAKIGDSGDAVGEVADRTGLDPDGVLLEAAPAAAAAGEGAAAGAAAAEVEAAEVAEDVANAVAAGAAAGKKGKKGAAAAAAAAAAPSSYEEAIALVKSTMRARGAEFFGKEVLKTLSPKFQAILDRLATATGPALVYSNFKTLEGVGLFGMALEFQQKFAKLDIVSAPGGGWALAPETIAAGDVPRYIAYTGDEDRDKRNILLAIFNGKWSKVPRGLADAIKALAGSENNWAGKICRVFMITQSGAEGISLSNVRQVHVMEPYWNYVRLDQVKGRAVRICSHMDLPPDQRHVDIYTYIARFSAEQLAARRVDETLQNFDGGKTTDQNVFALMNAKKKLADSLTDVMKASAVDCELNRAENGGYACYSFKRATMEPLFHPLLEVDLAEGGAAVRERAPAAAAAGAGAGAGADEE